MNCNIKIKKGNQMKKIVITVLLILIFLTHNTYATEESLSQEDIMQSQQEDLDINSFIDEADKYTEDVYEDIDMGELFSSAITGNIDNETIFKSILNAIRRRSIRRYYGFREHLSNYSNT